MNDIDIKEIIAQMTTEEKASFLSGADLWHTEAIERLGIVQLMMTDGPHGLRKQREKDLGQVHKSVPATAFPTGCASACAWDEALLEEMGDALGEECLQEQVSILLGPGANIKRSPLCGRNFEYFSEDPYLAGKCAAAWIRGVENRGIGTSLKHFACNNQEYHRLLVSSELDERTFREIYLTPFEYAVKEGNPSTLMCSYNKIDGTYASQNRRLLTDILREEWGFGGFVMSDWGAVDDRVKGVQAGLDLEMPYSGKFNDVKIAAALDDGSLKMEELDLAVERVLRFVTAKAAIAAKSIPYDTEKHLALAEKISCESAVLLRNESGFLPFDKKDRILVVGELAEIPRFQGGGSSHITPNRLTSLLDGLRALGVAFDYEPGYRVRSGNTDTKRHERAVAKAREYNKILVCAGLTEEYEAEGFDRTHMRLPEAHDALIDALCTVNANIAVALYCGSPVELPWAERVKSILLMYLSGGNGGNAAAKLLFGEANPCGKLAETFPKHLSDTPTVNSFHYDKYETFYTEALYVGYRYYDKTDAAVRYPFGHGLSYARFVYSDLRIEKASLRGGDPFDVTLTITNAGNCAGKEIVQIYVGRQQSKSLFRAQKELKGFTKVFLNPGESKTVTVTLDARALRYYDVEAKDWRTESGEYTVFAGASSKDIRLEQTVDVKGDADCMVYDKDALTWYFAPSASDTPFDQFEKLKGKKYGLTRSKAEKGAFRLSHSFDDMVPSSFMARRIVGLASLGIRLSMKTNKKDSGYLMIVETFKTTPMYKLSASSQGMFTPRMAEGVIDMLNGKFFRGLGKVIKRN